MKSHLIPAILAVLTALPATAQNLRPEEAATLPRIIDHQCLDLIEDMIGCENVILLAGEEDAADLLILPDARDTENTAPLLIARNFAYAGSFYGQWPSIGQRDNGSLVITAEQFGIGRSGWSDAVTLAWRNGQFVVAGRTRTEIDRTVAYTSVCDVNLLSGQWNVSLSTFREQAQSGTLKGAVIPAQDWNLTRRLPPPCLTASELLYDDAEICLAANTPEVCAPRDE